MFSAFILARKKNVVKALFIHRRNFYKKKAPGLVPMLKFMSSISKEQVEHIAKLARIELTEEEKGKLAKDLSLIVDYVEQLSRVDTKGVKPLSQVTGLESVMREDGPTRNKRQEARSKLLKEAPKRKGDYIKVSKILE